MEAALGGELYATRGVSDCGHFLFRFCILSCIPVHVYRGVPAYLVAEMHD